MSNSGNVSLNVNFMGQDEVSAMLDKIAARAKELEKQLKKNEDANLAPDVGGLDRAKNALGNTVEAVDKAEEKFNKLVGAIGFVSAAFAAATTVYTFIKGIIDAKSAVDATITSFQRLVDINKTLRDTLDQIAVRRAPNEAAKEAVEIAQQQRDLTEEMAKLSMANIAGLANVSRLQLERKKLAEDIVDLEKISADNVLNFQTRQLEIIASKQHLAALDKLIAKTNNELAKSKGGEAKLIAEIVQLEHDRNAALRESNRIIEDNKRKYQELIYMTTFGAAGIKPAEPEEKKPIVIPTATGPAKAKESIVDFAFDAFRGFLKDAVAKKKQAEKQFEENLERMAKQDEMIAEKIAGSARAELANEIEEFRRLAMTVDTVAESFDDFTQAVLGAADAFPDLGDAMNGINSAMQKHSAQVAKDKDRIAKGELTAAQATVNAEQSRTQAIIEGSTAGVGAIAKLIGGKKAEYAIRAAGEVAMGFATLTNPVESAGHFVAAGLFAAAAGTSAPTGGGAGGGAGAAQETPTSSSMGYDQGGGGQRTVVYNFSTLIADRQQVGRAIRDSELVGQRNGYGRRRGV